MLFFVKINYLLRGGGVSPIGNTSNGWGKRGKLIIKERKIIANCQFNHYVGNFSRRKDIFLMIHSPSFEIESLIMIIAYSLPHLSSQWQSTRGIAVDERKNSRQKEKHVWDYEKNKMLMLLTADSRNFNETFSLWNLLLSHMNHMNHMWWFPHK